MDKRIKETISIHRSGLTFTRKGDTSAHISGEYSSAQEVREDGTRIITLTPLDTQTTKDRIKAITETILEALGEEDSKAMRGLLLDHLREYWDDIIEDMYKKVVLNREEVKLREGCFKIIIGDGRRKDHNEIQLVD